MLLLAAVFGLVLSCSNGPSNDTIKTAVVEQIKAEGGKNIRFDRFEIVKLEPDQEKKFWRIDVKMKGTYTQSPHRYSSKTYTFDSVRKYEIHRISDEEWKTFVVGMNKLYEEDGSHEVSQ